MNTYPSNNSTFVIILFFVFSFIAEGYSTAQVQADTSILQQLTPDTFDYFTGDKDLNLCIAAFDGNEKAVLDLLNMGANMSYYSDGYNALQYAILQDHLNVVKILILNGADINSITLEGETPLILAVRNGNDDIADFLCQKGGALDSTDFQKRTALMYAVANGSFLLTDMLLFYGENPQTKDMQGNDALMLASYSNQPDLLWDLVNYSANINTADNYNNTPLIVATEKSYPDLADSLLTWGADPLAKNNAGYTALDMAIKTNNILLVKILLSKSNSLNRSVRPGIKPLDLAKGNPTIDSMLRKAGAHPSILPDYHEMLIGFDFSSNFSDYMNNIHIGLYDPKYYTSISLGFHARMAAMKLYVPRSETIWYQYWERRYLIWAGIDKQVPILHSVKSYRSGLLIGLKGGYTFGNYRGSSANAASKWMLIPSLQIFHSSKFTTVSIGYEYAKYPCFELSPNHLTASLKFHFPLRKESLNYKYIDWLQANP